MLSIVSHGSILSTSGSSTKPEEIQSCMPVWPPNPTQTRGPKRTLLRKYELRLLARTAQFRIEVVHFNVLAGT
jgi:hypothetical protein